MKKISLTFLSIFMHVSVLLAQSETLLPANSFQLFTAFSFNGTDNVGGFSISTEYIHYYHKKFNWAVGLTSTVHDGSIPVQYYSSGTPFYPVYKPGTVYYTTAGVQTNFSLGYSIVRSSRHNLRLQLGPMARYQTSSNPERGFVVTTNSPISQREYFETQKNYRTLSFGGIGQISYSYTFGNNMFMVAQGCLQYDSNDDAFNMIGFGIGKRFAKL